MGKKTDFLLRRNSHVSKLKELAALVISRAEILKKQHLARFSHARSDVIQLLNLGHQERALLRVEHVIKEQNLLDVFAIIENYCDVLMEKAKLFPKNRECPDEMKEPINSLIFAASRCGEFPEIQQIRETFTSKFGKEFAAGAVELRNNCEVNTKMIQKLTSRQSSYANRWEVLEQIASENGIVLHHEDNASVITEEKEEVKQKRQHHEPKEAASIKESKVEVGARNISDKIMLIEELSESMIARSAAAAQEAFASAAAVELSRSESRVEDFYDCHDSENQQEAAFDSDGTSNYPLRIGWYESSEEPKILKDFEKMHRVESIRSLESEGEKLTENSDKTMDSAISLESGRQIVCEESENETNEKKTNSRVEYDLYETEMDNVEDDTTKISSDFMTCGEDDPNLRVDTLMLVSI